MHSDVGGREPEHGHVLRRLLDRPLLLVGLAVVVAVAAFQLWVTPSNPPGYHRDEASLSLNAYLISTKLRDEDGHLAPLAFRSFDDYKSPLYAYVLAAVFRVTGPHASVARALSAVLVLVAVLLLGLLSLRLTGSALVAVAMVVLAGLTPWVFELGRVALEVSLQPLLVTLLLLALERSWSLAGWSAARGVVVGSILAALVYAYTGNRLLGPLLALALVVFAGRERWRWLIASWTAFSVLLLPLVVYGLLHRGALTARYEATTIARDVGGAKLVLQAIGNWFRDMNPWHWVTAGDSAPYVHNGGYGALLASVVALALAGAAVVIVGMREDLWWRYVVVATLLVGVPAALTVDRWNALRLSALPVFVLVLAIPALDRLCVSARRAWAPRVALGVLMVLTTFQFVQFLDAYRTRGPARTVLFEAGVPALLETAFADGETVYVDFDDRRAQAHARWYAVSHGLGDARVEILADGAAPPVGSTVFGLFQECDYACERTATWEQYWVARAVAAVDG